MGTLSSLTGAGSGGGGGDPQATFQASANVANGDLVVLNDNGTVEPVTSTAVAADFTQSDSGTKLYAGDIRQTSSYGISMHHNASRDEYVSFTHRNYNEEIVIASHTYNDSTGQYTQLNQITSGTQYYRVHVHNDNDNDVMLMGFSNGGGNPQVRGIYHNGTNWTWTNASNTLGNASATECAYVGRSADGTIAFAGRDASQLCATTLSWTNNSSTPVHTGNYLYNSAYNGLNDQQSFIENAAFYGAYAGGNNHVVSVSDANYSGQIKLVAFSASGTNITFGEVAPTGVTRSTFYGQMAYDPVGNVGITGIGSSSGTEIKAFTVNSNLSITIHGTVANGVSAGMVGFNPTTKLFFVQSGNKEFTFFNLNNQGAVSNSQTGTVYPNLGGVAMEFGGIFPRTNSAYNLLSFQASGNAGGYINSANHMYTTQFAPPYIDTNVDDHFGEAKETITSGNAGPVAILNRSKDITGSSFQKGQKLFANPSGSALATSGTYRVGYATDGDTILVTGDPS
jgi:hypothetical protein